MKKILSFFLFLVVLIGVKAQNCTANFNYQIFGDSIVVTDSSFVSFGGYVSTWDFGDGRIDTGMTLVHTYNSPGNYLLCLNILTHNTNCNDSICVNITIPQSGSPCDANFSHNTLNNTTSFTNTSNNLNAQTYFWDFGDGSTSTLTNPTHSYQAAGDYAVTLQATDSSAISCSFQDTVKIRTCQASFLYQQNNTGAVSFTNTSASRTATTSFSWNFGDGSPLSFLVNPTHVFQASGTYTIELQMIDSIRNCFDSYFDSITVNVIPPCVAGFGYQTNLGAVSFNNLASSFTSVFYDFGDGTTSMSENPTHQYLSSGTYTVCQTVTNDSTSCTNTFCDSITVNIPLPCLADFDYTILNDSLIIQNKSINYSSISYDFGDGQFSTASNPIHSYQQSGQYVVTQIVFNQSTNCTDTLQKSISINVPGSCEAEFLIGLDTNKRGTLYLINTSSDMQTHSYNWNFGDGGTATGRTPTHIYQNYGAHTVCLTVTDSVLGCTSTYCDTIGLDSNGNLLKSAGYKITVIDGSFIGVEEEDFSKSLRLFPNPFKSILNIRNEQLKGKSYQLLDLRGQIVLESKLSENDKNIQLQLSSLRKGLYVFRWFDGSKTYTQKVVKL